MSDINRLYLPPVALLLLADVANTTGSYPQTIREIICAGDQLTISANVGRFIERLGARLRNQYGPTETHVATEFLLESCSSSWPVLPPIGRAIDNTRLYILDEELQPVPIGVPGHLYIGGVPLARGYLNRPVLTAERFLPDPFGESGMRMYKTGDLVRYLSDRNFVFLGRLDHQVKIRGFRIEPGEVEAVLCGHKDVAQATVAARRDPGGQLALVAYVVPASARKVAGGELRQFLDDRLPGHMVPSMFEQLDALPLSPNGKVDRQALPEPNWGKRQGAGFVSPRNSLEEAIARIWAEVLRLDRVGVEDNFFDLGGHSLLATQVVSRVRQQLAVDLPLRVMFEPPTTVAELAKAVVINRVEEINPDEAARLIEEVEQTDQTVSWVPER